MDRIYIPLFILISFVFAYASYGQDDLFFKCEQSQQLQEQCVSTAATRLELLDNHINAIDRFVVGNDKVFNLQQLDEYQRELAQKKEIVQAISHDHQQRLIENIDELKNMITVMNQDDLVHKLNQQIESINDLCKVVKASRSKLIHKIDPSDIRLSQVVVRGTQASNRDGGIQKEVQQQIREGLHFFDEEVAPDLELKLREFFANSELSVLIASPTFNKSSGLSEQMNFFKPKSVAQKCLEHGNVMRPIKQEGIAQAYDELLDRFSTALDEEISLNNRLKIIRDDGVLSKTLNAQLAKYVEHAPLSIGKLLTENNSQERQRILCDTSLEILADERTRQNINRLVRNATLGLSVMAIPLTYGVSASVLPLIFAVDIGSELFIAGSNIHHELKQRDAFSALYLRGGNDAQEYLEKLDRAKVGITKEVISSVLSTTLNTIFLTGVNRNSSKLIDPQRLVSSDKRVALKIAPNKIPDNVSSTLGLNPTLLSYSPLKPLKGRKWSALEKELREDVVIQLTPIKSNKGINESFIIELNNGKKAIFKPHYEKWSSNYRAEVLAYELDQKLGFNLVPVTVERELLLNGKKVKGSVQAFVDGKSLFDRYVPIKGTDLERQMLFDYFIGNKDRHLRNYLVNERGTIHSIDNGLSFSGYGHNRMGMNQLHDKLQPYLKTPEGKELFNKIAALKNDVDFKKELEGYLSKQDVDNLFKRIDNLIEYEKTGHLFRLNGREY